MLVPGHLAAAAVAALGAARLTGRRGPGGGVLLAAALGGLTPDLLDKSRMALGGSVYGRTIGHSLLFLTLFTAAWAALRWRSRALATASTATTLLGFWVLGVASHLAADLVDDALRGWMGGGMMASSWFAWPWATPYTHAAYAAQAHAPGWPAPVTPAEIVAILAAALWLAFRFGRRPPATA